MANYYGATFWITVAQIIPVLALAFVIEQRALVLQIAERNDTDRYKRIRWGRVATAVLAVGTALWLFSSFVIALLAIACGCTVPEFLGQWALYSVLLAGALVTVQPVTALGQALVGDVWDSTLRRLPWSRQSRLARTIRAVAADPEKERRQRAWDLIDMRITVADVYIDVYRRHRLGEAQGDIDADLATAEKLRAATDEMRDRELEGRRIRAKAIEEVDSWKLLTDDELIEARDFAKLVASH